MKRTATIEACAREVRDVAELVRAWLHCGELPHDGDEPDAVTALEDWLTRYDARALDTRKAP
jgi:hypothetical protein